jgi:hypothetical protein
VGPGTIGAIGAIGAVGAMHAAGATDSVPSDFVVRIHVLRAANIMDLSGKNVHVVLSKVAVSGPAQVLSQSIPVQVSRFDQADILHEVRELASSHEAMQLSFTVYTGTKVVGIAKHGVLAEVLTEPVTLPLPMFNQTKEVGFLHVELQSYSYNSGLPEPAVQPSAPLPEQALFGADGAPGAPAAAIFATMLGDGVPLAKVLRGQGHEIADPARSISYLKAGCWC